MLLQSVNCSENSPLAVEVLHIDDYPLHMHDDDTIEIIFVKKGSFNLYVDIENTSLSENDIFIVNARTLHGFSECSKDNLILLYHINTKAYSKYFPELDEIIFILNTADDTTFPDSVHYMRERLNSIAQLYFNSSGVIHKSLDEQIMAILMTLINYFQYWHIEDGAIKPTLPASGITTQYNRARRIIRYMYDHFDEKLTLDTFAKIEYVSKYYISHLLKDKIGLTFQKLLDTVRVESAFAMMLDCNDSLEEVAANCGFSSPSHFRKIYKSIRGATPFEDRKKYRDFVIDRKAPSIERITDPFIISRIITKAEYEYDVNTSNENTTLSLEIDLANYEYTRHHTRLGFLFIDDIFNFVSNTARAQLTDSCESMNIRGFVLDGCNLQSSRQLIGSFGFACSLLEIAQKHGLSIYVDTQVSGKVTRQSTAAIVQCSDDFKKWCDREYDVKTIKSKHTLHILKDDFPMQQVTDSIASDEKAIIAIRPNELYGEGVLRTKTFYFYSLIADLDEYLVSCDRNYVTTTNGSDVHVFLYSVDSSQNVSYLVKLLQIEDNTIVMTKEINKDISDEMSLWNRIGSPNEIISADNHAIAEYIRNEASPLSQIKLLRPTPEYDFFKPLYPGQAVLITLNPLFN